MKHAALSAAAFGCLILIASPTLAQQGPTLPRAPDVAAPPAPTPPPAAQPPSAKPPSAKPPSAPPPTAQAPATRGPAPMPGSGKVEKGEPGMMGLPWPKTNQEAQKTISDLLAHLATDGDALHAGQIAAAIERLWRFQAGDTVNLLVDRGMHFLSRNEIDKAVQILDAAVDLQPDYTEAWVARAAAYARRDEPQTALADLRRALALDPNHFRALDGMAKLLLGLGEKKGALKAYDQLLKVHPQIEGAQEARDALKKELDGQGI